MGSATYTVLLDACVLYPAPLRDILLSLACADLFHARWTREIENEWLRNLLEKRPDLGSAQLQTTVDAMRDAVPDCLVTDFDSLIAGLNLPDPDDRHVLAAAIVGHVDAIVTLNLRDFPVDVVSRYNIEVQHPDDFVMNQLELREFDALVAIKAMRERLKNPPKTASELIDTLERQSLVQTARRLRLRSAFI